MSSSLVGSRSNYNVARKAPGQERDYFDVQPGDVEEVA
jgi:hypothetical protein